MENRWTNDIKKQRNILSLLKNKDKVKNYFQNLPDNGYVFDSQRNKMLKITEIQDSTLRRLKRTLLKYYTLVNLPEERKILSNKLKELDTELEFRENNSEEE